MEIRIRLLARRWSLIGFGAALLAGGMLVYRNAILTAIGRQLVVAEMSSRRTADAAEAHLLVHSGDRVGEVAAEYLERGQAGRCLVLQGTPSRIVQLGALPLDADLRIDELMKHGVSENQIMKLEVKGDRQWDWAREVGNWLQENPQANVLFLSDQFSTHENRAIVNRAITPALAQRVELVPLPDRRYDETNWWTSRLGIRRVGAGYLSLAYVYLVGEPEHDHAYRTPDEYEAWFLEQLEESRELGVGSRELRVARKVAPLSEW